ncbi:hypothetical protein RclHR1_03080001 [Rhizophagus clarus]|uniref:RHS repeat-associated core domain-containing protein n=1 Tax=Rhizophagus clarus TaxID=94130 RepID=A0A2Z6R9V1_9GLOM|nr:hypothetical protein RclHR1_03080001 [Rhizophagus clarus]GES86416.1 RHS repeat-associated core domain-containing protein [Rhizophagus clarus]
MEFEVDPRNVLYSQDSIRSRFRNDELIEDTIKKLVSGEISPGQIRCIRICILNGKMHSLDNRRLYAFKEAIERGSRFRTVIAIKSYDFDELQSKMSKSPSSNDWSVIRVRGKPKTQHRTSLFVNSSHTRIQDRPSISVTTRMQDRTSFYVNSVPTRTQDRPSISVSSRTQDRPSISVSSRTQDRPSISVSTRMQDRTSFYVNSVPTRTQDRPILYANSSHTRTQDRPNIFVNSVPTRTQGRPSLHTGTQDRPQSVIIRLGDDDEFTRNRPPKDESCCIII